ncbi:MAG TPA: RNA polymerase sigma-70 factor [Vicinamibacterales bacterium]|nr:RNA polymerase sigma-70 factor [Vicinamibacterales bacterium]
MIDTAQFQSLRSQLFSVAYRMLGSAAEAEDVVQDAWLRAASSPEQPTSARAWLTTVVTRLCLDRLKAARTTREQYVGPWLPEPVPTGAIESAEDAISRRESVTMAFLTLLETLSPAERAAFLLREVFDADYADVARVLETTPANARQLVHRAKTRVAEGRPRFEASPERQREMVTRFFDAVRGGSLASLEQFLAADVTFTSDGGGKAPAAMRPVIGAASVAKLISGLWQKLPEIDPAPEAWRLVYADINGEAAALIYRYEKLESVFVFSTDADRITTIRVVRNPDKLAWLAAHREPPAES